MLKSGRSNINATSQNAPQNLTRIFIRLTLDRHSTKNSKSCSALHFLHTYIWSILLKHVFCLAVLKHYQTGNCQYQTEPRRISFGWILLSSYTSFLAGGFGIRPRRSELVLALSAFSVGKAVGLPFFIVFSKCSIKIDRYRWNIKDNVPIVWLRNWLKDCN